MVDLDTALAAPPAPAAPQALETVPRGMRLLYGGNRLTTVPDAVADAFRPGDALVVVQASGDVLHIPGEVAAAVDGAVRRARAAFAAALAADAIWDPIAAANAADVERARARGRSTTRLVADERMRAKMIEGLRLWRDLPSRRDALQETVTHDGWRVEQRHRNLAVYAVTFVREVPNVTAEPPAPPGHPPAT